VLLGSIALLAPLCVAAAKVPDCSGRNRWSTRIAYQFLKNAGLTNDDRIAYERTETKRLAVQPIGKDLWRQIQHIRFVETSGKTIEVITDSEFSSEECSMGDVQVYVISRYLDGKR
jgi:hypothetical protein